MVAKELQFAKDVVGRRGCVRWFDVVMVGHEMRSFAGSAAPIAAFVAIPQTAGGTGQHPELRGGPQRQRRMAVGRLFCFAMQRPEGPAENSRNSAIAGPGRLPSDRPLEGRGRAAAALGRRDRAADTYPRQ